MAAWCIVDKYRKGLQIASRQRQENLDGAQLKREELERDGS